MVKKAPDLRQVEIRRPVCWGLGILSQNAAPQEWSQVIPKLSGLKKLRVIVLSFPGLEETDTDRMSIEAARAVLKNSTLKEERTLVVRRVIAQHYDSPLGNHDNQVGDIVRDVRKEVFSP